MYPASHRTLSFAWTIPIRPQDPKEKSPSVSASRPRRFEFRGGTSSKFWEICVSGIDVTVRFGRIGSQGQTNVKSFSNKADVAKHAEHVVRAKLAKGYFEVG